MRCKRRGYFTLKKSNINFKTSEYLEEFFPLIRLFSAEGCFCWMFLDFSEEPRFFFDFIRLFEFQ